MCRKITSIREKSLGILEIPLLCSWHTLLLVSHTFILRSPAFTIHFTSCLVSVFVVQDIEA